MIRNTQPLASLHYHNLLATKVAGASAKMFGLLFGAFFVLVFAWFAFCFGKLTRPIVFLF